MKKTAITSALLGVLLLAGCSAPGVTPSAEAPSNAPKLTAEPVAPTPAEEEFMTSMGNIPGLEGSPAEAAIPAGEDACAQIAAGTSPLEVLPVEGADEATNEEVVVAAVLSLCPEFNDATQQVFVDRRIARISESAEG